MGDTFPSRPNALSVRLLAGSALAMALSGGALAQTMGELPVKAANVAAPVLPSQYPHSPPPKPPPADTDDALGPSGFYLEADTLIRNEKTGSWTARGGVEARYRGRTVRADQIIYDVTAGVVTADGHVEIMQPDGSMESGSHVVLDDRMRAGFAQGFALHAPDGSTFAADVAIRRSAIVNELNRAAFTPCQICAANGERITPTWSIRASKVIEDHAHHLIFFRHAIISIKGVPVAYTPVFWLPDPQSPRQSGLLLPKISSTSKRGLSYEQPYLQVLSPSEELTISPQINSDQNPFLDLEWRKRFYSGQIDARIGYTYSEDFDGQGHRFGPDTSRSFILSDGRFDLNSDWSWGFSLNRASDPLIFEKYDIPKVFNDSGQFGSDTQRLLSDIFAARQDSNSYLSISALDFQGLRTNAAGITENSATFPIVAPLIEAYYEPKADLLGGRVRFVGDIAVLTTQTSAIDPASPGLDSRRGTAEVDWQRNFTLTDGLRLSPFLDLRTDLYNVQNLTPTDRTDRTISRGLGTAGLDISWPFVKQTDGATIVLEPLAQIDLSPNETPNAKIPNTDSVITAFDETNLFSTDRFSGFDRYEGGQRFNIGGRATVDWGDGLDARVLVGRTFRAEDQTDFPPNTGLGRSASDWVVAADTTPVAGFSMFGRTLLNDQFNSDLTEVGVNFARDRTRGYFRYDDDNTQITGHTRDFEAAGEYFVTKHWGFSVVGVRDIELRDWRVKDFGVIYLDDCVRVEVVYQHEDTVVGRLGQSDSVFVRLNLAILGDEGYRNADFR